MKKLLLATIAAAGLLAGCASDAGLVDQNLFADGNAGVFDTNRNGMFERAEYSEFGDDNFGLWDTNRDGWIDTNEFGVGWNNAGWDDDDRVFDTFDDDSNDFLDTNEFFGDDEFGVWDTDRDGLLDNDEWGF